ncbi:MAG: peptidase M50 [Acidobacteria bacterium]|nr:MAG: peptidase M50 [Acidobacteriota bacterium]PYY23377.1 MAG: peptidase M50 [Acidobacteriota bacterium]
MIRAWSIPVGRFFGTEVRLHLTFFLLLALLVTQTKQAGMDPVRGVALFFMMLAAVVVQETARALFRHGKRDRLQRLVLLPIGGVVLGETSEHGATSHTTVAQETRSALAGPVANLLVAGMAAAILVTVAQQKLIVSPYIHSGHLARSLVWINVLLGLLNLVPAYPLAAGRVLRVWLAQSSAKDVPNAWEEATRKSVSYGQGFSMLLTVMGFFAGNIWAIVVGFCVFIAAHLEDRSMLFQSVVSSVRMEEIMLTDFAVLSPADTLQDALEKALHTLQDDFPVVRSGDLVGTITRQKILDAIRTEGNGYVQSVMNRVLEVCQKGESLATAFRKITIRGLTMIPVVDQQKLVGIVTLQNLSHNMGLLAESRRLKKLDED